MLFLYIFLQKNFKRPVTEWSNYSYREKVKSPLNMTNAATPIMMTTIRIRRLRKIFMTASF